jgi:hypothetical protein
LSIEHGLVVRLSTRLAVLGRSVVVVGVVGAGTQTAFADVVSETRTVSNQAVSPFFPYEELGQYTFPQWSPTVQFAQFDPALGTLAGVTITVQTGMSNIVLLTGENPGHWPFAPGTCEYTTEWRASITAPGSTVIAPDHRLASGQIHDTLGRFATYSYTVPPTGPSGPSSYTVDAADFSIYAGTVTIPFVLAFDAEFIRTRVYQCSVRNRVFSSATLTVEYEYTPVPSPGAAAALSLGGLLAARRRR